MEALKELKGYKLIGIVSSGDFEPNDDYHSAKLEIENALSKYLNGFNPYNYNQEDFLTELVWRCIFEKDEDAYIFMTFDGDLKKIQVLSYSDIDDTYLLEIGKEID